MTQRRTAKSRIKDPTQFRMELRHNTFVQPCVLNSHESWELNSGDFNDFLGRRRRDRLQQHRPEGSNWSVLTCTRSFDGKTETSYT